MVFLGDEVSFVPAGASKTKSRDCYSLSSTSSIAVSLTLIEFLRLLYLPPATERIAGFYISFRGHARLLGQKNKQKKNP